MIYMYGDTRGVISWRSMELYGSVYALPDEVMPYLLAETRRRCHDPGGRDLGKDDLPTGGLNNHHIHIGNLHLSLTFSDIQPYPSDLFN